MRLSIYNQPRPRSALINKRRCQSLNAKERQGRIDLRCNEERGRARWWCSYAERTINVRSCVRKTDPRDEGGFIGVDIDEHGESDGYCPARTEDGGPTLVPIKQMPPLP